MLVLFLKGSASIRFTCSAQYNADDSLMLVRSFHSYFLQHFCQEGMLNFVKDLFFSDNDMGISVKSLYILNNVYLLVYLVLWCSYLVLVQGN